MGWAVAAAAERLEAAVRRGLAPAPALTVSEWADRYRVLTNVDSGIAGRWSTDRAPYMRAIMDAASARAPYRRIVLVKSAQIGFTAAILNIIGYRVHHCPGAMLVVQPNVDPDARKFSKQRLGSMIRATAVLRALITEPKIKGDASNTVLLKEFAGGMLMIAGANSAAGLRQMPIRDLYLDELDEYPPGVGEQGDPVTLAEARTSSYRDTKIIVMGSTPTIEGRSRIIREAERCERVARYCVPCPHCGEVQPLEWERLRIKADPVVYECRACERGIDERHKGWMLDDRRPGGARWVFERDDGTDSIAFTDLSALYAAPGLGVTWTDLARRWLEIQSRPEELRAFVNTRLARAWRERYDRPEWRTLYDRAGGYERGTVPAPLETAGYRIEPGAPEVDAATEYRGPCFLTAGCDVQKGRLEIEVVAWGRDARSWSVQYLVLPGDPAEPGVWRDLDGVLGTLWPTAWGTGLPIRVLAIDTGYATERVYSWIVAHRQPVVGTVGSVAPDVGTVMAVKGTADFDHLVSPRVGKVYDNRVALFLVGTGMAKRHVYDAIRLPSATESERAAGDLDPPGFMRFPRYEEGWFIGLTSNRLVRHERHGMARPRWEADPAIGDEPLDCRVYARAAAHVFGLDRFTPAEWAFLERLASERNPLAPVPTPTSGARPIAPGGLRRRGGMRR